MIQRIPPAGVIERWQPALDRIAPRTTWGHTHLRLVWEPGEEWAPVERWVIWEMMHPVRAPRLGIWADLKGPPPRWFGRYDHALEEFVRTRHFTINQRQWQIHHETGLYGRPVWIVQGARGGHKRFWAPVEQNLIRLQLGTGELLEPPAPGDLPYALPNQLTIEALAAIDRVRVYGDVLGALSEDEELRDRLDRREREQAREMADQLWGWLGDQVEESLEFTRAHINAIWDGARDDGAPLPDYDAEEEAWKVEAAESVGF